MAKKRYDFSRTISGVMSRMYFEAELQKEENDNSIAVLIQFNNNTDDKKYERPITKINEL